MQGFNMGRYVPPEHEGQTSGNKLHRKRPPGVSAGGTQTVRFELPFAIWCTTCKPDAIIGQGVRFNAAKTRVGAYYSTPILAFRFRHPACGGTIEVRTDPANTTYIVTEGAKKRDYGPEEGKDGAEGYPGAVRQGPISTAAEREAARESAFSQLEKTIADREVAKRSALRVEELAEVSERGWADPYARNRALRDEFRKGRKERERQAEKDVGLKGRLGGLDMELLPEIEDDRKRAALMEFGAKGEEGSEEARVLARPLFPAVAKSTDEGVEVKGIAGLGDMKRKKGPEAPWPNTRAARLKAKTKEQLISSVLGSTRAAKDPFLEAWSKEKTTAGTPQLPALKRKRATEKPDPPTPAPMATKPLVDYGSESD